ncbi:thiosulfate sulfurtransferase GlpE [Candidatus Enterovibrio altilux]|nr:thiosulfate sulfurtransferase GlpE [Candidatus Enterovibrio luxaltus]
MEQFAHISVSDAWQLLNKKDQSAIIVDIRDSQSFRLMHPQGAFHHITDSIVQLMQNIDYEKSILVICSKGVSSQGIAQYLHNQGVETVYSVDGGFEAWHRQGLPVEAGTTNIDV